MISLNFFSNNTYIIVNMTWYLLLIWLTLFGYSNAVITKRSNPRQQNFGQYEIQTFQTSGPASPLANIIDVITAPLNILTDRLTRQPGGQQLNPGYGPPGHQGPPGHYGPPGQHGPFGHYGPPPPHHRPHGHRGNHGHHGQQQHNSFQYPPPPPPVPSYLNISPSREQFNNDPMKINPQNPFLNKNTNSERQPGSQFSQGQFPQSPNFALGQNYPKPGFSNYPGNANLNTNDNNDGNTGCIGFCEPPQSQPQRPNQFENNGFDGNNFGGFPNDAQTNNGFGTQNRPSSQSNGLIQSTFGGLGTDGIQTPQSPPTNQFGSGGFVGGSSNTPQPNNNGLIQTTFGGLDPQSQSQPPWPPVNNVPGTQNGQNNGGDLIQSTFSGFEPGQQQSQLQPAKPLENDGLISSIFGSTERPQINNQQNPSSTGFGQNGIPNSQTQPQQQIQPSNPNQNNGLISSIFAGLPIEPQSGGNNLVAGVFPGIGTPAPLGNSGNSFEPITEMNAEMKANNDLIDSIFSGVNDGNGQSNVIGTTTVPPSTTNSNGLIYDIDVRSS